MLSEYSEELPCYMGTVNVTYERDEDLHAYLNSLREQRRTRLLEPIHHAVADVEQRPFTIQADLSKLENET